jgi:anti-anti-sigma factor
MPNFGLETQDQNGVLYLTLRGELDIGSAGKVEEELRRIEQDGPALIVLDLRKLDFMDSSGLRVIMAADQRAREEDRRVAVIQGPDAVRRVFEITRLDERLEIVEDPSALDGVEAGADAAG